MVKNIRLFEKVLGDGTQGIAENEVRAREGGRKSIVASVNIKEGSIIIRPIMYLALSYDHRIIDGKEAVSFLKTVKECLEEPRRLFLDL